MAEQGRREKVRDPLELGVQASPDRSVPLPGVSSPRMGNPFAASEGRRAELDLAVSGLDKAVQETVGRVKDEAITTGKQAYLSGVTEAEIIKSGDRYTQQGYHSLAARDTVNNWYAQEAVAIDTAGKTMNPADYQKFLNEKRKGLLDSISDPVAKRVAVAAFEELSPRLAQSQTVKSNEYNKQQTVANFTSMLTSTAQVNRDLPVKPPGGQLAVSATNIAEPLSLTAQDRDIGIKTLLGEAGGEGAEGMAAVAHVLRNRATSGQFPTSITGVAMQAKQFSMWNDGGGKYATISKDNPAYIKAGEIIDAVMGGKHVDPTNSATHYYSPQGMKALYGDARPKPLWFDDLASKSGNNITIGGHVFTGKATANVQDPSAVYKTDLPPVPGANAAPSGVSPYEQAAGISPQPQQATVPAKPTGTQIEQFILGTQGLDGPTKAKATADAIRRSLDADDPALFDSLGGVAILHKLGAEPADIDEVLKARERYNKKQENKFSAADEAWRSDVLGRAEKGEDLDLILKDIDDRVKSGAMSDERARGLAQQAADKWRAETGKESSQMSNVQMLNEIGMVYQYVSSGSMSFEDASAAASGIARKYGATENDVRQIIGQIFSIDQGTKNSLRQEAKAKAEKYQAQAASKAGVDLAISRGYGLDNITGEKINTTSITGQPGATVTPQEYGIQQIKDKHGADYAYQVASGQVTAGEARAGVERNVFLELQKHGVVDKETSNQMVGAVTGEVIDKKTGQLTQSAIQGYNTYVNMRTTPQINDGYIAKTIDNVYARNVYELAYKIDAGNNTGPEALIKAKELLDNKEMPDVNTQIARDNAFNALSAKKADETLRELASPDFWSFRSAFAMYDPTEIQRAVKMGAPMMTRALQARADVYHMQYPWQDPEVSLKLAADDLKGSTEIIQGNAIISGEKLHKKMGLNEDKANAAVQLYLEQYGALPQMFGEDWTKAAGKALDDSSVLDALPLKSGRGILRHVPVNIQYLPSVGPNGAFRVSLYEDEEKGTLKPNAQVIPAEAIGKNYIREQQKTSWTDNLWDAARRSITETMR
jgi:spore germination cell wall hydrolase CwlJ-like protein